MPIVSGACELLVMAAKRTYPVVARTDANDPELTAAASKSRKCGGLPPHRGVLSFALQ
jgi:hypothetical protein